MKLKISVLLIFSLCWGVLGHAKPPRYYKTPAGASVQIRGTVVNVAKRSNRLVWIYAVDDMEIIDFANNRPLKVAAGQRKIGIFLQDRAGRMNGNFTFSTEAGHKYRLEADRHPSLVDESLTKMALSNPRKGLIELPEAEASSYSYRLKLIDETNGQDVVITEIPAKMTDERIPLPDEK